LLDDEQAHHATAGTDLEVFMLYASPIGYSPLNVRAEVEAMREAFEDSRSGVRLHVGVATAESLTKILTLARARRGLVLHLSVHATSREPEGFGLVLEDSRGRPHILWRQSLEEILGVHESNATTPRSRGPSLLFLSACWSQQLAQIFVECGCPHVISLRTQVHDAAARRFAQQFYLSLAVRTPLLLAWESARRALRIDADRCLAEQADNFLLFGQQGADRVTLEALCGGGGKALEEQRTVGLSIRELEDAEVFLDTKVPPRPQDFVGRAEDIYKILSVMHKRRACVIHGPEGVGKSALAVELAHFASAPGRLFSCAARVVRLETARLAGVAGTIEEALESLTVELRVSLRLWSGCSRASFASSHCSTPSLGSRCSVAASLGGESPNHLDALEQLHPARERMRTRLQQVERSRRSSRVLLIIDDEVGVVGSSPEVQRMLGELLDHTYRLHVLVCSREPIYQCLGATKAVNLPLSGLDDQEAARLLLQRIHRMLEPADFFSSALSASAAPDVAAAARHPPTTMDDAVRLLRGHALLRGLGGNPGAIRAVGARVHDGGPTLAQLAAALPHHIPIAAALGETSGGACGGAASAGGSGGIVLGVPQDGESPNSSRR